MSKLGYIPEETEYQLADDDDEIVESRLVDSNTVGKPQFDGKSRSMAAMKKKEGYGADRSSGSSFKNDTLQASGQDNSTFFQKCELESFR